MLTITKALPNPAGKDRVPPQRPTNDQLNGEWVEFANTGNTGVNLAGIALHHTTFNTACAATGTDRLMAFQAFVLAAGHSIRVHTGAGTEWVDGTVRHLYCSRGNYAWNNRCGDTAMLYNAAGTRIDHATYEPRPPEGAVLYRVPGTNHLVPRTLLATGTYGGR